MFEMGQRVRHRTGERGFVTGQPDGDPIIRFDGEPHDRVCYRSEIGPEDSYGRVCRPGEDGR